MNSYPIELLAQHVPLMFVAGLSESSSSSSGSISPSISPSPSAQLNSSPPTGGLTPVSVDGSVDASTDTNPQDPFAVLVSRLKTALTYRKKGMVWDPSRGTAFQVMLVDKNVRFPPRKVTVPSPARHDGSTAGSPGTPRSPLSPMTPTSPLYPDGLIAPIWVRKHVELVPSVFVLFLRLSELPPPASPLEGRDDSLKEEEKRRDADLAAEIGARKKVTGERGIKLTVVLLASRRMLDDPSLDARLSFIRRQSGLDSRAALFVLSPVSAGELNDFVKSLQSALHEPAMEYYAQHSKRVRRKRNRHSHTNQASISGMPTIPTPSVGPRPLRSVGWSVRYEYKLALFAEFRMEEEVARKHYEDCWSALVDMFGSTAVLPPRTKRWAEAKVLADCIAIKLSKLYLYHNEPHLALATFNRHVQKFAELSRGWGIGEETFEFWSWMARSYRILGELLELALRTGFKLPNPTIPSSLSRPPGALGGSPVPQADKLPGLNPSNVLQHPGYYFYTAANCTLQRYERYLNVLDQEEQQPGSLSQSPGFANERKVEHHVIIVELYTKAYELFKRYRTGQSRQTFYIAYRIAETYHASGKYEAAIRFFERIAKTYRREQWGTMLRTILLMWYDCARHLGEMELTVKLLFELLAPGVALSPEERATFEGDLEAILKKSAPPNPDQLLEVALPDSRPIFDASMLFWRSEVAVEEPSPFQLTISAPADISFAGLAFTSLRVQFGGENGPSVTINHAESAENEPVERVDIGNLTKSAEVSSSQPIAHLRWPAGTSKVLCGTWSSSDPGELKATSVTFGIVQGQWNIEIPMDFEHEPGSAALKTKPSRWLSSTKPVKFLPITRPDSSTCTVRPKPHRVQVDVEHPSPGYLDEKYPLEIRIVNVDERELDAVVDVLLHPAEDESVNRIVFESEESTALIKGVSFGVIPAGGTVSKTMYLFSSGSPGIRILDVSIRTRLITDAGKAPPAPPADEGSTILTNDSSEILRTISVPIVRPFATKSTTTYHRSATSFQPLLDLGLFDRGEFDPRIEATTVTEIVNTGKWEVEVDEVSWNAKEDGRAKLFSSSITLDVEDGSFPLSLHETDQYAVINHFNIDMLDEMGEESDPSIPSPGQLVIKWKRHGCDTWSTSTISPPPLAPPSDKVIGILALPPSASLHHPFLATLTIQNRSSSRTADLVLQTETSEAFVVAGPRTSRLPTLLPGTSYDVRFNVVPMLCGVRKLPAFKIYDRRREGVRSPDAAGENVTLDAMEIVDERWDSRDEKGVDLAMYVPSKEDARQLAEAGKGGVSMLVLPFALS